MKVFYALIFIAFFAIPSVAQTYKCLSPDVNENSVVNVVTVVSSKGGSTTRKVTVRQTLKKLKATCRKAKLIDGTGKEIRFYKMRGCWGNPPVDYPEILERQRKEIEKLRKRYTIIEINCSTGDLPYQLITRAMYETYPGIATAPHA